MQNKDRRVNRLAFSSVLDRVRRDPVRACLDTCPRGSEPRRGCCHGTSADTG